MNLEEIAKLKRVKANPLKWLKDKSAKGFQSYTFTELVALKGYEGACKIAVSYLRCVRDDLNKSLLVKSYCKIHAAGYYIEVHDGFGLQCFKTDASGYVYPDLEVHFRDIEAEMIARNDLFRIIKTSPYV